LGHRSGQRDEGGAKPAQDAAAKHDTEAEERPHPDDPRKPDDPTDLTKHSWKFVLKKVVREFSDDQCTDLAAALTYYAVLGLFPAVIAVLALVGVFGQGEQTAAALLGIVDDFAPEDSIATLRPVVESLANNQAAGFALLVGLLTALWAASGYVGAFSRAMNRIYEIEEGRPVWKLKPQQILITLVAVSLVAVVAIMLIVSGPLARSVGNVIGLGGAAVTAWQIAKWPILVAIVVLIIAILYYATPNVKQPKFRWMSMGAFIALVTWVVASILFATYVGSFGNYNKTYGTLAGVIVFLLWLWITNLALLFGAEVDAEVERGRQLQAGMAAEEELQLPARDTRKIKKSEAKEAKELEQAERLRSSKGERS
jgi:membrane protein